MVKREVNPRDAQVQPALNLVADTDVEFRVRPMHWPCTTTLESGVPKLLVAQTSDWPDPSLFWKSVMKQLPVKSVIYIDGVALGRSRPD